MGTIVMMRAGWLSDLTDWIKEQIQRVWDAFEAFVMDMVIYALEQGLELVALAFEALPVPSFLTNYSVGSLLANAGPEIGWAVQTFKIGECCAMFAAALAFRISRKILTFGKW
ncbi:phage coat protein [Pseudoxanthomonas mexicana]|jgi:hypothetical protein|uniref:phage coat protein n=1 Tax=Pseudoxanthomonas mexicana TaxID=128785 RepID=UPI001389F1C7|nr:phage coat protein [Pseudoxanthomonas mexicana]KAF1727762.1 phage coat protein [Pseudoxanthomonas mexicana]